VFEKPADLRIFDSKRPSKGPRRLNSLDSNDLKEQVRSASDIVDVVGTYLSLRKQGRNYVALCPWHDDSRPSFQVSQQRQSWRCWVCGIGGDVFSFVMKRESMEFREALELLAERAGVALPSLGPAAPAGSADDKKTQFSALAWAERLFHETLLRDPVADEARRYLHDRGITQDSIQRFHIGFSPNDWNWMSGRSLQSQFGHEVLEKVGLLGKTQQGKAYDRFKGRVIFSIRDVQARPIGFGGRILPTLADERSAKYVNSPETRLFSKSENLYALDLARDTITSSGKVIVVEGYTDVIALHQAGIKNAVAVLGTALGPKHIHLLKRYAETVYLVLDGDDAGQKRTSEVLQMFLAQQVDLRICTLPDEMDPCDYVEKFGKQAFDGQIEKSLDALEHKIRIATSNIDLVNDLHGANDALEDVLDTLAQLPSSPSLSSDARLREHQFLARVARKFQVGEQELRTRLTSLRTASRQSKEKTPAASSVRLDQLDNWDRLLLELLLGHPDLTAWSMDEIGPDELIAPAARQLYQAIRDEFEIHGDFDFSRMLGAIENESLRFLLLELDEASSEKNRETPEEELRTIIEAYRQRHEDRYVGQRVVAMEKDELDFLQEIVERQRNRQGISDPKDGG